MLKMQYYVVVILDGFIVMMDYLFDWLMQFGLLEGMSYDSFICDVGVLVMGVFMYEWLFCELVKFGFEG